MPNLRYHSPTGLDGAATIIFSVIHPNKLFGNTCLAMVKITVSALLDYQDQQPAEGECPLFVDDTNVIDT